MATAAQLKAERIAAQEAANTAAYRASLTATPRSETSQMALSAVATATGAAIRNNAPLPEQARTGITEPAVIAKEDTPLTQTEFDTAVETGDAAARAGQESLTGTPLGGTPLSTIRDTPPSGLSESDKDAYALLKEVFINYGLEELVPSITKLMSNNVGPNQASLMLKTNPEYNAAYIKRFAGNESRRKAGLNVLSEAEYLDLENSYSQTLNAFGLKNYFGATTESKRNAMANIIGSDISATEFKDRVDTVVSRVNNADPSIKETLKTFYGIKEEDLTSYFLNPADNLPKLQEKVSAAEIGAAAANQKLAYSKATAEDLAKFGITKAQAQEGYSTIGEIMPTASKLGEIYGDKYDQATAEQEVFKGTASAKRKRQQLAEREAASFSGSSGRMRTGRPTGNTGQF
jgi:hypothetical protein